jgi:methyl-accepting chemotaxis protein
VVVEPEPAAEPSLSEAVAGLLRLPFALLELVNAEATFRRALEAPARIERLAVALERAATLLEVLVTEVDPETVREAVARLDRLAASAEKAASMIDRLEMEVDVERLGDTITRVSKLSATAEDLAATLTDAVGGRLTQAVSVLDRLLSVAEEMNRNIRQIEGLMEGVRGVVGAPLQLPGVLRRVLRDAGGEVE